jgi:hypothetical protein
VTDASDLGRFPASLRIGIKMETGTFMRVGNELIGLKSKLSFRCFRP